MAQATRTAREQLETFKRALTGQSMDRSTPIFQAAVNFIRVCPVEVTITERAELQQLICSVFNISPKELMEEMAATPASASASIVTEDEDDELSRKHERELWALLPKNGFFRKYAEYTSNSESPLAYHFYCSLVGVGAMVNRQVCLDMGYFKIYPVLGVIILGPSGIKKTTGADIITNMLRKTELVKIYSEKLTPEALIDSMGECAQGLIYAPEMASFLSKARYMDGMIPLLTRLMDCPDKWESGTIMRGKHELKDVAISSLMCSTIDWFISNTPEDTFGGGFVARNILVVQNHTHRVQPIPRPGNPALAEQLIQDLVRMAMPKGEMTFTKEGLSEYEKWYKWHKRNARNPEHDLLATYYQRKPSHALRVAICLHMAECNDLYLCSDCFNRAVALLDWTEKFLPSMFKQMFRTSNGADQEFILRYVAGAGGSIDHSTLIRKVQYKFNAPQVKAIVASLKEAGQIGEIKNTAMHVYTLTGVRSDG